MLLVSSASLVTFFFNATRLGVDDKFPCTIGGWKWLGGDGGVYNMIYMTKPNVQQSVRVHNGIFDTVET